MKTPTYRPCAGHCGRVIHRRYLACAICWHRLPRRLRDAVSGVDRTRHATWTAAMTAAHRWFDHHPPAKCLRVGAAASR